MTVTYATRRSALALAQSRAFVEDLKELTRELCIAELLIVTSGDKNQEAKLQDIGGKGLFIKELEEALLSRRADFAIHSIKDVPAELVPGLCIACVPLREAPQDALVSRSGARLAELPAGSRVGTSSMRRELMIRRSRPDLVIEPLRGNVDTRLRKVDEGELDATVLAYAGLKRLGLADKASEVLDVEVSIPAIGQGALGIECREDDAATRHLLTRVEHPESRTAVEIERAAMIVVEGNCRLPVAAHARRIGEQVAVSGVLADPDGSNVRLFTTVDSWPITLDDARRLGADFGKRLKAAPVR